MAHSRLPFQRVLAAFLTLLLGTASGQDTWCGKVYNGSAQIIPGGFFTEPEALPAPLLDVQVITRHSLYVGDETTAELIVDALLSPYHGAAYTAAAPPAALDASDRLDFTVTVQGSVVAAGTVGVDTADNLFSFDISQLTPSTAPYPITLTATTASGANYTATSQVLYLPSKATGSVVKIDRLYGAILYKNNNTAGAYKPVFPYGYYGSYDGLFNTEGTLTTYKNDGFTALNIVSDFTDGDMTHTLDEMDGVDLMLQYSMRHTYRNLTSVEWQNARVRDHPSLLTYYTADEPDGWGYTPESGTDAYHLLATLDPYHPTALVLNCQNFYFEQYTVGADIIMEDAYPVGVNTTYTWKWDTPCNLTYGDCGCDNCEGGEANLLNVATRVDDFKKYATWLGGAAAARKPIWAVPQAFSDPNMYWRRDPTADEAWAMDLLAFNHGAMGRMAWLYPGTAVLNAAAARLAQVVTVAPVVDYLTGANPVLLQDATDGVAALDVAYWSVGGQGVLVGAVNPVSAAVAAPVRIALPEGLAVSAIASAPWGNVTWALDGTTLVAAEGLAGHATSYVVLQ